MSIKFVPGMQRTVLAARLGLCAAALVGTLGMVSQASATIVTFTPNLSVPNSFDGAYINLLTGATGTSGTATPGWDWNPYNSGTTLSFFWSATPSQASAVASTTTGPYTDVAIGSSISAGSTFAQVTAGTATAAFQTAGTHRVGFRFYNETTATVNYGYAVVTSGGTTGFPFTINSWSFENNGGAITVVPEPGTALMLSMGALALGALQLRRSRRGKA